MVNGLRSNPTEISFQLGRRSARRKTHANLERFIPEKMLGTYDDDYIS
jgi:hypothetical protein